MENNNENDIFENVPQAENVSDTPADNDVANVNKDARQFDATPTEDTAANNIDAVISPDNDASDNAAPVENDVAAENNTGEENQNIQNASYASYYSPALPKIKVKPVTDEEKANNKGLKIFAFVLAVIIGLTVGMAGGYYFGSNYSKSNLGKHHKVNLASKPNSAELTAAEVYEKNNDSIVGICVYNSSSASNASGVVYSKDGYIISNDHIFEKIGGARIKIYTSNGKEYNAKFVAGDQRSDITVLKITDDVTLKPATFGNPDELYIGESVVAMGRPTGADTVNNLTTGTVSLVNNRVNVTGSYLMRYIQTDTAINPGSSGGALLNMYGQVVGITSSKLTGSEYEGMCFAIPASTAVSVAESLIKNGCVKGRARLGITYTEVTSVTADVSGYEVGLRIASVDTESSLYGKVSEDDTIISVNGNEITRDDVILDIIESSKPGDTITVTVKSSDGSVKDYSAKLLADEGTTNFSAIDESSSDNSNSSNSSEFTFPFGD